jgi:hypothetical protein
MMQLADNRFARLPWGNAGGRSLAPIARTILLCALLVAPALAGEEEA